MALNDLGEVPAGSVLPIFFTSHDGATGANEAASNLAVGDVLIYKGTSVTQRSSTAGISLIDTDGLDIDGLTGVNGIAIDLSDNTDPGFYAVGSFYNVVLGPITIDAQTVYLHLATFRIVAAEHTAGYRVATIKDGTGTGELDTASGAVILTAAYDPAKTAAQAGDAMSLTSGERTTLAAAIWAALTSGLSTVGSIGKLLVDNVNATISSRLASSSYTAPLDAAGTRTAVGLNAANLDTQLGDLPTNAELASGLAAADDAVLAAIAGLNDVSSGDVQTAAAAALTAYDPPTNAELSAAVAPLALEATAQAILTDTAVIGVAGAGLTAIPWNAAWDAQVESEVADALEAAIADSIPADGSAPSVKQALYMLTQFMLERSVSSTTVTVKKPDGSTTLFTLTLNSASAPTSITRAT